MIGERLARRLLVLALLLQRPGLLVTRDDLRTKLWPSDTFVDFDHSLNTAINKLRDALGDGAANPRFIETLPRRGYRFIAPVKRDRFFTEPTLAVLPFDNLNRDPGAPKIIFEPGDLLLAFTDGITEPDIRESARKTTAAMALPAETFARMVAFAIEQPDEVDVNEILFRPTRQEL